MLDRVGVQLKGPVGSVRLIDIEPVVERIPL